MTEAEKRYLRAQARYTLAQMEYNRMSVMVDSVVAEFAAAETEVYDAAAALMAE